MPVLPVDVETTREFKRIPGRADFAVIVEVYEYVAARPRRRPIADAL
jgi:hypothetical protein